MSDGVDSLMSAVELMNHDWFLWFVVIPTGTATTVTFSATYDYARNFVYRYQSA
ncbi:hypothetical protein [Vibrio fluvialis]|uniref:hypothetical protein n=1 Tax=Vibrio fluvialis TaxID=676 RepID=UPI001EECDCF0|nr:hypothetical protein [Vibrio fluvialis]